MKLILKKAIVIALLSLGTVFLAYSEESPLENLQKGAASFSEAMAKALPFNSAIGLNWSDAYIGKLAPSIPPHFGIGGSVGATTLDLASISAVTDTFGFEMPEILNNSPLADKMILPAYAVEARIGGIFLPFDIGVKFGKLPPSGIPFLNLPFKLDYTLAGADIRWALVDGKSSLIMPNISIGAGANYLSGGINASIGGDTELSFDEPNGGPSHSLYISSPDMGLLWETFSVEGKLQISKELFIITPYAGIVGGYSWSKAGYALKTDVTYDGQPINENDKETIGEYLDQAGLQGMNIDETGISSMINHEAWNVRAFGGFSLNILALKLDLTAMYNILDGQLGAQFGLRVQL